LVGTFLFSLFIPQIATFTYKSAACVTSPQLLPGLFKGSDNDIFEIEREHTVAVGNFAIYSHKVCVVPNSAPASDATYIVYESLFGNAIIKKPFAIKTAAYPQLSNLTLAAKAIQTDEPIHFEIKGTDETFSYSLAANKKDAPCANLQTALSCNASKLDFKHNKTYDIKLLREFNDQPVEEVISEKVKTLTPVKISKSSIGGKSTVYNKPKKITLHTNKKLQSINGVKLTYKKSGKTTELPTETSVSGKKIVVTWQKQLPRRSKIELRVGELRATDKSGLAKTYTLPFTTSGGPKVAWVNIGDRSVGFSQDIVISFDQKLLQNQNLKNMASLQIGGKKHPVNLSVGSNYVTLSPASPLPRCAKFTLQLTDGVKSKYKISGDSGWSYSSRAQCYTTFSIGASVQGRGITGYKFGGGSSTVLYVGAMHGDEGNSKYLLDEWINELEGNPDNIPGGRSIVVIPLINPDGFAAGTRTNAHNVDLNRNFPANNWKPNVVMPSGKLLKNGGGKSPLSEPESKALANYVQATAPKLTLTYHSKAAVVVANESGNSVPVGQDYASRSGYGFYTNSSLGGLFAYDTTGAFEDWMHDKLGRSALLIELATSGSTEFWRNKDAMWHAARIP
jgi:hypothetical protein